MDEQNTTQSALPEENTLTDAEIAAMEAEREASAEAKLAPFKAAARQRQNNANVIAEHDDILADMLYEMTLNEIGMEV